MFNNKKIIVSMTSYPKRISSVGKSLYYILTKQTVKPDEIHLWLAEPEFKNKEKDLPEDLNLIIKTCKEVYLHWLPKNTYCHKRHEIFKQTTDNDLVFIFDEDVIYKENLIEKTLEVHEKYPDCIINYNLYSKHIYSGKKIIYKTLQKSEYDKPRLDIRFFGQSMIPSKLFPKQLLTDKMMEIRDKCSPICDESWLTPWFVYYGIKIYCEQFGWGTNIATEVDMWSGLIKYTHQKEANGLERRDNWLSNVLTEFPEILSIYKKQFNYG